MKKLIALLSCTCTSLIIFAYPITPRPLRKLVIESQYIVWGKVIEIGSIKTTKKNENIWERDFALIAIREKLQGKLQSDTVKVSFSTGMICPAPGVFFENEDVLVFLDKKEKGNDYMVHALSYGVKHGLGEHEYRFYKERIIEMQAIIVQEGTANCSPGLIDWFIKCAEKPYTRWDGLYELSPQSDFMSYYDGGDLACKETYITINHRKKLFDVLLSIDTLSYSDIALADITVGINDTVLLDFLKSRLLRVDTTYYWPASDIMNRIVILTGSAELKELVKKFEKVHYGYEDKDKTEAKNILRDFILKMANSSLQNRRSVTGNDNVFSIALSQYSYSC